MTETILVTGASGYIAKHLIAQLLQGGYRVRGSVRDLAKSGAVAAAMPAELRENLSFVALDLTRDNGWADAMADVTAVMHTASPFPMSQPKDANDLIRPAVDGALRALRFAAGAGVTRVIMTSSIAAIMGAPLPQGDNAYDESHWTNPDLPGTSAYTRSKTLAERAAWDWQSQNAPDMQLTTINPGLVVGAPLDADYGTSVNVIKRILAARDPMVPQIGFSSVDVHDVAALHLAALRDPATAGERIMGVESFLWFADMAQLIKTAHPDRRIVERKAPNFVVRILALFDPSIRQILPSLGKSERADASRAIALLNRPLRDVRDSVVETADWLIAAGQA